MKRRTWLKSLGIIYIASFIPKWVSASWASLASNQLVNGSNLQDAVNNSIFTLKSGQTITKTDKIVLRSEANTWLNIEAITNDNRGVKKFELVPFGCDLAIAFVSKTNETSAGANDGSITISGTTTDPGGFKVSKNGGASYPYTGTNPYTFTGLAPGDYSICAINDDGTCSTCLSEAISISGTIPSDAVGIIVVDVYDVSTLEICGFIDGSGSMPYDIPVYKNGNNYLPNSLTAPANCWALASDLITSSGILKFRFEFNVKKLILTYPSEPTFVFKIRGRGVTSGSVNMKYDLKGGDSGDMTMTGTTGSLIPSVASPSNLGAVDVIGSYGSGANGNIGLAYGSDILTLTYTVATKTVTYSV